MNNEIKRRIFLTSLVGTLIGLPVAVRLITGKKQPESGHRFSKMLKKYQALTDCRVASTDGPANITLPLRPSVGAEWRYIFFAPNFFPDDISMAVGQEPDAFFVRDGVLLFDRNQRGQTVVTGGDVFSGMMLPVGHEETEHKTVTLLVEDDRLISAKPKGTSAPSTQDMHLVRLLGLSLPKGGALKPGLKWTSQSGRVRPYTGYTTHYEIAGYAEINGVRTLDVRFQGKIPNIIGLPGVNSEKPEPNALSSNSHQGHCYFDLETGFLVRQEMEMDLFNSGIKGFQGKDGDSLSFRATSILQILPT